MTPEQIKELTTTLKSQVAEGQKPMDEAIKELGIAVSQLKTDFEEAQKKAAISLPGVDEKKFSFTKCLAHVKSGRPMEEISGYEGEVIAETMKAQTTDPASAGGVFIPTELSSSIIELAIAQTVLNQLPIQRITVQGNNPLDIPSIIGDPTASWVDELADIPESQMEFAKIQIKPNKIAAYVAASNEMLSQRNINMESMIRSSMSRQIALGIDLAGLSGDGVGKPTGILQTAGILTYRDAVANPNGEPATWQTFDALQALLENENTFEKDLAYISKPQIMRALRNQTIAQYSGQADGSPLFNVPFMSQSALESHVGYPMKRTTQLAQTVTGTNYTSELIYGDFSQFLLAMYGNLELASDSSVLFRKYGTVMRAVARMDSAVLRPKSFAVATAVAYGEV